MQMLWYVIFKFLFMCVFGINQDLDFFGLYVVYVRVSLLLFIFMRWYILIESSLVKEVFIEVKKGGERGIMVCSVKKVMVVSNFIFVCKVLVDFVFFRIYWLSLKDE